MTNDSINVFSKVRCIPNPDAVITIAEMDAKNMVSFPNCLFLCINKRSSDKDNRSISVRIKNDQTQINISELKKFIETHK